MFASLWDAALREAASRDLGTAASLQAVARETGEDALQCLADLLLENRAALVQHSASLLSALTLLWAARGIEPDEIWMELHKRERLGTLLHELAAGERPVRQRRERAHLRPWRVDSTKLP